MQRCLMFVTKLSINIMILPQIFVKNYGTYFEVDCSGGKIKGN